jgi:hypothetical protein
VLDTTTASQNCSNHFSCTWDATTERSWRTNRRAFGVQLFHYLNVFHDYLQTTPIGFTEAAGNFQLVNEPGQGLGEDPVQGQFIDGANLNDGLPDAAHLNNANMTTFADGEPPVCRCTCSERPGSVEHPSGDSAARRDRVPRVRARLSNRLVTFRRDPRLNAAQSGAMVRRG